MRFGLRPIAYLKRRWKFWLILLLFAEIYVQIAGCANTFILYPSTDKRDTNGAVRRTFTLDGKTVELFTDRSIACGDGEPKAFVLYFIGNGSRADDETSYITGHWRKWPVEVWGVNYPGYGGSTGPAKLKAIPPVALAAYDQLKQVAGSRPIFIESNSLGGTSAMYVASNRPVAACLIKNPPPLRRLIIQRFGWWNLWLLATPVAYQVPWQLNTPTTAPNVHVPACFVLADEDEVIPPKYHDVVVNAYAGPKTIVNLPYATHNSPTDGESQKKIDAWINQQWDRLFGGKPGE